MNQIFLIICPNLGQRPPHSHVRLTYHKHEHELLKRMALSLKQTRYCLTDMLLEYILLVTKVLMLYSLTQASRYSRNQQAHLRTKRKKTQMLLVEAGLPLARGKVVGQVVSQHKKTKHQSR